MELSAYLKLFTRVSLIFFSICLFAWVLLVDYRPYLAGLMLGGAASAVNIHLLGARVQYWFYFAYQHGVDRRDACHEI